MAAKDPARKRHSPARKDTLARRLEGTMGDDLIAALIHSGDPRAERLTELLFDPAYARHSLGKLCERCGLKSRDLMRMFRQLKMDEALIVGLNRLPGLLDDLMTTARSAAQYCRRCDGFGDVEDSRNPGQMRICPACEGAKVVRKPGDDGAARLILEALGLIGKGARVTVQNVQVNSRFDVVERIRSAGDVWDVDLDIPAP